MNASRAPLASRVARNTGLRVAGEIAGKLAVVVLFAVMARELGREGFGDFVFAASLGLVIATLAGLGSDDIVPREIAVQKDEIGRILWDALGLKLLVGTAAFAVAVAIGFIGDYSASVRVTLALVAASGFIDQLTATFYAVFQGLNDLAPEAAGRTLQLGTRAAAGVAALLAGGGIVVLGGVYLAASTIAFLYAATLLVKRVRPARLRPSRAGALALAVVSLPIGVSLAINVGIVSLDTVILSALKGNVAVGLFGAGQRLVDSTVFAGSAFAAALMPMLAKSAQTGGSALDDTFEGACKVIASALLPVSLAFALFADPITRLVYGSNFESAATVVRLLAPTVVLFAVSTLSLFVLISRHRQGISPWVGALALVQNVVLMFLLVPGHSVRGAGVAFLAAEVTYAVIMVGLALRETGRVSVRRIALGPAVGGAAMALAVAVAGTGVVGIVLAGAAYVVAWFVLERAVYPDDLALVASIARRRVSA